MFENLLAKIALLVEEVEAFVHGTLVLPCAGADFQTRGPRLDASYLHRWLSSFSDTLGQPLAEQFDDLKAQA